jgi:YD repeat-containing protein
MKHILGLTLAFLLVTSVQGQFYYKDLLTVGQTNDQWKLLKSSQVKLVKLQTYEANNQPSEDFSVQQRISGNRMTTVTQSPGNGRSELTANYDASGRLISTVDTTEDFHSSTMYAYDAAGRITSISNNSRSGEFTTTELHTWTYNAAGRPTAMLRIRNGQDTTYVNFVLDEKGNPIEEHGTRKGVKEPSIYYYYDDKDRLTDIVRYNVKAARLLPTHVFSWNAQGRLAGMLLVPEGTNEYQRWFYDYDERGLKVRERAFDKRQQLMGKVEFVYE